MSRTNELARDRTAPLCWERGAAEKAGWCSSNGYLFVPVASLTLLCLRLYQK